LRLFLDEVGNNGKDDACEDGTNDYQNDSQYREASHSIDPQGPIIKAACMVRSQALLLKAQRGRYRSPRA